MRSFSSSISRALRVLLTCIALAVGLAPSTSASHADISASIALVRRPPEARRLVRPHLVLARPRSYPSGDVERAPASTEILPSALFGARRTFLINCSLRC